MENTSTDILTPKKDKSLEKKKEKSPIGFKKIDPAAFKQLMLLRDKANKKDYGRRVTDSEILALAISLIEDKHIKTLQDQTYSEMDRLNMSHAEFQKTNGKISLDQYIGKLLKGQINTSQH